MCADPESAKKDSQDISHFALLGSTPVKAERKLVGEIKPKKEREWEEKEADSERKGEIVSKAVTAAFCQYTKAISCNLSIGFFLDRQQPVQKIGSPGRLEDLILINIKEGKSKGKRRVFIVLTTNSFCFVLFCLHYVAFVSSLIGPDARTY